MKKLYVTLSISLSLIFGAVTVNAFTAYFALGDGLNFEEIAGFDLFAGAGAGTDKPIDLAMTLYYQGNISPIGLQGSLPAKYLEVLDAYNISAAATYGVTAFLSDTALAGTFPAWDIKMTPGAVLSLYSGNPFTLYQIELTAVTPDGFYPGPYTITTTAIADGMIYTAANPVPVPAAVWLLASGLLGLVGLRRKNS